MRHGQFEYLHGPAGLNPCCNGIYSMSKSIFWQSKLCSLNPCCNGIYSMSGCNKSSKVKGTVLILVVMEYTQ